MNGSAPHLLGIEDLPARDIVQFLDTAEVFFDVSRGACARCPRCAARR
jgi:hypothetical protein